MMDLVSDAVEAVRFLQNHPQIDPTHIAVMGHSEGAIALPLICQKNSRSIAASKDDNDDDTSDGLKLVAPIKGSIFLSGFGDYICLMP
jgi:dienelactone hydrolase